MYSWSGNQLSFAQSHSSTANSIMPRGRQAFLAGTMPFLVEDVEVFVLDEPKDSVLLRDSDKAMLSSWVGTSFTNFTLCYRLTNHGSKYFGMHTFWFYFFRFS